MSAASLLQVENLSVWFSTRTGVIDNLMKREIWVKAVEDVSFSLAPGEILGIAGESGSGKSTLSFTILQHYRPRTGRILFEGRDLAGLGRADLKAFRRRAQLIFQDPYQSLNPRFTAARSVAESLLIHGIGERTTREKAVIAALEAAGLRPAGDYLERFPHELSGGQRQRVAIARAVVLAPSLLIADEPVSMLDVSVRAGILKLLRSYARERGVGILYVSHDLGTIRYICDRVAVMQMGRMVEIGPTDDVIGNPQHAYTKALIAAVPEVG